MSKDAIPGVVYFSKPAMKDWPLWLHVLVGVSVALRILWQFFPDPLFCALFWTVSFIDEPFKWRYRTNWGKMCILVLCVGAAMNAVVTLANNGTMPVEGLDSAFNLWTPATTSSRLAWLGDNYGGFSLGDLVLGCGLVMALAVALATPITEVIIRRRHSLH